MPDAAGDWQPLSVEEVSSLLDGLPAPWWLAGGWALDLHLGRCTRPHEDIDVLVLRHDLPRVQRWLGDWSLHAADPPGSLRPWRRGEVLPVTVHDIWVRRQPEGPWALQLMVDDTDGEEWVYRRDPRIRRPVVTLAGPASTAGRPVLAPEVQLLYKSHRPRPKDVTDFHRVASSLTTDQRTWLHTALSVTAPGHAWFTALQPPPVTDIS